MAFITINGRILDEEEYRSEVSALRFELMYELIELLSKYGFEASEKKTSRYYGLTLAFYNKELTLSAKVIVKQSKKTDSL